MDVALGSEDHAVSRAIALEGASYGKAVEELHDKLSEAKGRVELTNKMTVADELGANGRVDVEDP